MKIRIDFVVDVSDEFRRALRHRLGKRGRASVDEIRQWVTDNGTSADADLRSEHEHCCWKEN